MTGYTLNTGSGAGKGGVAKTLGNALSMDTNTAQTTPKTLQNTLYFLRTLIKECREKNNSEVLSDLMDHGVIKAICRAIIDHNNRPQLCVEYIRLAGDILREEEVDYQDMFLDFMKSDTNNEFISGVNNFLKVEYSRLKNSE